jgi:hypothetical protein
MFGMIDAKSGEVPRTSPHPGVGKLIGFPLVILLSADRARVQSTGVFDRDIMHLLCQ